MMRWINLALGAALAAAYASHALGQDGLRQESKQPFEIIQSIEALQDQIVLGSTSARAKLPALIEQLQVRLLASDREVWRDTKNARAAVIYTLSGGPPRVIRKVIDFGISSAPDLELMRGALAYVEGRETEAKKLLSQIDASALPAMTGGHIAVVQSALIAKEDPRQAIQLLDQARIRAPGTLIEDAALRRELVLADETADIDKFATLSSEYLWRFRNSVYFDSFRQRFAASVVHFGLASEPAQFAKVESLVGERDSASQLRLYLQIAHRGIVEGKAGVARLAAGKAFQLSADGGAERARSTLYEAAALILTDQYEAGMGELRTVDTLLLPKEDIELKEAVLALARSIGSDPAKEQVLAAPAPGKDRSLHTRELGTNASALIDLVQDKLAQTDEVLERNLP
jgi:chemotaxis protein MotC